MISHQKFVKPTIQNSGASLDINEKNCIITIKVGTNLDLRLHDLFMKAIRHAQGSIRNRIVVDLEKTQRIFDSGLALLLLLDLRSWRKSCKVHIINCDPELEQRIERVLTPGMFNLSRSQKHAGYRAAIETEYLFQ